eukprot:668848-Rhodomonas_salina.1
MPLLPFDYAVMGASSVSASTALSHRGEATKRHASAEPEQPASSQARELLKQRPFQGNEVGLRPNSTSYSQGSSSSYASTRSSTAHPGLHVIGSAVPA